jgi:hypothetical protein
MSHPTRARVLFVAALLVAAVPGACGRGSGTTGSHDAVPSARLPVDVRAELAPAEDRDDLLRAEQSLAARCMRQRGLGYTVSTPEQLRASRSWDLLEEAYLYGVPAGDTGTDFGLTRSSSTARAAGDDPNAERVAHLSTAAAEAWNGALYGVGEERVTSRAPDGTEYSAPADGCHTQALVTLFGSFGDAMRLETYSGTFSQLVRRRVAADPELIDATERWSRCAKARGLDYEHPSEALGAVRGLLEDGPSRRAQQVEERGHRMAVACEEETHIYELGWKLTKEALPAVLEQEAGNVADYRSVVATAREILARDG